MNLSLKDIEPICFGTNINQSDALRPDIVGLTLGELYFHFAGHQDPVVRRDMMAEVERRWKRIDQDLVLTCAVFNPFVSMSGLYDANEVDRVKLTCEGFDYSGFKADVSLLKFISMVLQVRDVGSCHLTDWSHKSYMIASA